MAKFFTKANIVDMFQKERDKAIKNLNPTAGSVVTLQDPSNIDIFSHFQMLRRKLEALDINYARFDYQTNVKTVKNSGDLFLVREEIFYQLILCMHEILGNQGLYEALYAGQTKTKYTALPFINLNGVLDKFALGIFGSITATSDIDVGFQYSGLDNTTCALHYVLKLFEDMFLILLGKRSLDFDIEGYATMVTIPRNVQPQVDENNNVLEDFFLDTRPFELKQFLEIVPYAYASIYRNMLEVMDPIAIYLHGNENKISDVVRLKCLEIFNEYYKAKPAIYDDLTRMFELMKSILNDTNVTRRQSVRIAQSTRGTSTYTHNQAIIIGVEKVNEYWYANVKTGYQLKDYDSRRTLYYEKVFECETLINTKKLALFAKEPIDKEFVVAVIQKNGASLICRAESHICAPTITHVVRIMQGLSNDVGKKTANIQCRNDNKDKANVSSSPFCTLGFYGYVIALMEQIGFVWRWTNSGYCGVSKTDNHKEDDAQCDKKINKYATRLNSTLEIVHDLYPNANLNIEIANDPSLPTPTADQNCINKGNDFRDYTYSCNNEEAKPFMKDNCFSEEVQSILCNKGTNESVQLIAKRNPAYKKKYNRESFPTSSARTSYARMSIQGLPVKPKGGFLTRKADRKAYKKSQRKAHRKAHRKTHKKVQRKTRYRKKRV